MNIRKYFFILLMMFGFVFSNHPTHASETLETVTLQLIWKNQFQFAGYYVAKELGFYADAGLDVTIKEYEFGTDVTEEVISQRAHFGVGRSSLILESMEGKPVYLLSAIFQHSPFMLLAKKRDDLKQAIDLKGKRIMVTDDVVGMASLTAMLTGNGIKPSDYTSQKHTFSVDDLISGKTDAIAAYISNEPYQMEKQGVGYTIFSPKDYGFDFYSDILFTSQKFYKDNPQLVERFHWASLRGWEYAFSHIDEVVDIILNKYNTQNRDSEALRFEANTLKSLAMVRNMPLGNISKDRVERIAQVYQLLGFTTKPLTTDNLIYNPKYKVDLRLTPEEQAWLNAHPVVRVHNEMASPPFNFAELGRPKGFSIDYLRLLTEKIGFSVEFITGPSWDEFLSMMKTGDLDVMLNIAKTPERQKYLAFTPSYVNLTQMLYTREDFPLVRSIEDLYGKKIAVPKGFYIAEMLQEYPQVKIVEVRDIVEAIHAVSVGKADALYDIMPAVNYLSKKHQITNLKVGGNLGIEAGRPMPLHLAVSKNNAVFARILSKGMGLITDEEFQALSDKWLGQTDAAKSGIDLTQEEQAWLQENPVIRVHNEKDWPPFNYFEYGAPRGLSIDYMNLLAKRLGIKVEYVTGPSWNEFLGMIKRKELDVMLNIVKTEARQKYLLYTDPYFRNPNVIISTQKQPYESIEDLFGKTVAFPKGFFWEEVLTKSFPQIKRLPVEDSLSSLKAVMLGKADATLGEDAVLRVLINKNMLTGLRTSGVVDIGDPELVKLRIGVRNDWHLLHSAIIKAMADIAPQEMQQMRQKWIQVGAVDTPAPETAAPVSFARLFLYGIVVFLIICLLAFILVKTVRKELIAVSFGSPWFRGLVLAGLSVFVLITVLLGLFVLERNKVQQLQSVDENLKGVLSVNQERLDLWLGERISYMVRLGRDPELVEITKRLLQVDPDKDILLKSVELRDARSFFKNTTDIFSNIGFFIINPEHISIGSMRDANIGSRNLISDQHPELLKRAFQGKAGFIPPITSDVHLDNSTQSERSKKPPTMFFIGPVQDTSGRVLAVMTLRVDPWQDLGKSMKTFGSFGTGESYAFDQNGRMLSPSRFEDQLRRIGLLSEKQSSALNIEIRDPGGNMVKGHHPDIERSQQPLTHMVSSAVVLQQQMKKADIRHGHSTVESNIEGYRDYRGVPVFGAWLWNADLEIGLTVEIDMDEALSLYRHTRATIFGILGFTLFLSVGAILFVLIVGERASRALMQARNELEERVEERTAELKEQQGLLQAAEKRSRLLLNSAGEGIFGVDEEGICTFANPAALNLLGLASEELVGQPVHDAIHHSHTDGSPYPVEDCPMFKAFTHGSSHQVDDEVLWRKDGTHFPVEYSSTPMEKNGRIVGAVITFRDITERKAAEERFSALLESAPDAMVVSDKAGDIVLVNSQTEKIFGYSREELIGKKIELLVPEEIREVHPDYRTRFYADPERMSMGFRGDFFGVAKDKREIPVDIGLSPIETDEGLLVVASIRDITERKRMEEALNTERERLQGILDTSPVGVAISTKGIIRFGNPRFKEMFSVRIGDPSPDLYVHSEERDILINKLTAEGKVENYELQMYGQNREIRDMIVTYLPINYEGEDGILGWLLDITDRKKVEQEIKQKYDELARFRRLAIGREQKMIELKKEINELLMENGLSEKYKIH